MRALVESALSAGGAWNRLGLQWAALTHGTLLLFTNPAAFTPDLGLVHSVDKSSGHA